MIFNKKTLPDFHRLKETLRKKKRHSFSSELITLKTPQAPEVEAYHTLRTNLLFSGLDKPLHSLLITSPLSESGKTTTVGNLGVTIARTGARVLIVDSDLRRPRLHRVFKVSNAQGLTSLMVDDNLLLEELIQKSGVENLYLLTSGPIPPNPSELLISRKFQEIMATLKENFDFLILDSPPVLAVSDPALLSRYVDGTLLVIDFGRVPRDLAQKTREQLDNVKARIVGVLLNKIPANGQDYYYQTYYQSYDADDYD